MTDENTTPPPVAENEAADKAPPPPAVDKAPPPPAADKAPPAADKAPPAKGEKAGTALEPAKKDAPPKESKWGDDWRAVLGGEDEKSQKLLERYNSPEEFVKAHLELRDKLSKGGAKKELPEKPTPEQIKEFRKEKGIPQEPEGYFDKAVGMKVDEEDQKALLPLFQKMHERNISPDVTNEVIDAFLTAKEEAAVAQYTYDSEMREKTEDALRDEFGAAGYHEMVNRTLNFLDAHFPEEIREQLKFARLGDDRGTPIFSNPSVIKAFAQLSRLTNPSGRPMEGGAEDMMANVESRIKEIESMMRDNRKGYYADSKVQEEYRDLLTLRDKHRK